MKNHWQQAYKEFFNFGIFLLLLDILIIALYLFSDVLKDTKPTTLSAMYILVRMVLVTGGYLMIGLAFKAYKKWAIPGGYILSVLWFLPPFAFLPTIVGLYFLLRVYKAQKNQPVQQIQTPPQAT